MECCKYFLLMGFIYISLYSMQELLVKNLSQTLGTYEELLTKNTFKKKCKTLPESSSSGILKIDWKQRYHALFHKYNTFFQESSAVLDQLKKKLEELQQQLFREKQEHEKLQGEYEILKNNHNNSLTLVQSVNINNNNNITGITRSIVRRPSFLFHSLGYISTFCAGSLFWWTLSKWWRT